MARLERINRRLFLTDAGRGSLAIAILGPTVLASCSSDGELSASTSTTPDAGATTGITEPENEVENGAESSTENEAEDDAANGAESEAETELAWERVVLGNVSAYVLARGREVAIVDTGGSGSGAGIGEALGTLGAAWTDVGHVVLTHLHPDHVGGLPEVLDMAPDAVAWAGEADIPGIAAPRTIQPLNDGDEVFGLQVIATPGHTAGHISVLDPTAGFLVAGDALNESAGMILGPNPDFSSDIDEANASVVRLAEREFETVVVGHGAPIIGGASDAVVALAQTL